MHKQTERYQKSNVNLLTWLKGPHDIIGKWWNLIWFNSVIIYWLSLHGPTRQWRMHEEEDRVYTSGDATLFLETQSNYPDFSLVANAPVLRCRSHFFLQVSWWVRALKWSCTQEGGCAGAPPPVPSSSPCTPPLLLSTLISERGRLACTTLCREEDDGACWSFCSFHSPSWSPVATSGPGTGLCTPCALDLSISVY